MPRSIQDAALPVSKALPAAGASNASSSIDLGQTTADAITETMALQLTVPALPSLADAKNATFTFKDSADNATFAAIPELATLVRTGAGGAGAAATSRTVRLPATTRRYVRVDCAVDAAGGDSTGVSITLQPLF